MRKRCNIVDPTIAANVESLNVTDVKRFRRDSLGPKNLDDSYFGAEA